MTLLWICRPPAASPWFRRSWAAIGLGALLLALAACAPATISEPGQPRQVTPQVMAPPPTATAPEPRPRSPLAPGEARVVVALLVPLTGGHAPVGEALLNAAQMALFDIGDEGFAMMVRDTGGTPEGATRAANEAIAAGAELVLGPVFAASTRAVAPIVHGAGVNLVSFSTDRSVAGDGVFVMGLLPQQQVERVVGYAARQGLGRIAALVPNSAYGQTVVAALKAAAGGSGATVATIEYYAPGATDVSDSVRRLANYDARSAALEAQREALAAQQDEASKEALARLKPYQTLGDLGFDAILMPEGGAQLRAIAPLLPFYDIDPTQVRLLGSALWQDPGLGEEPALVGGWFAAPQPEPWERFQQRYRAVYGTAPPRVATLAYDATALAAVLGRDGAPPHFAAASLTQPSGFAGTDGIFRFRPDGTVERGLAVLQVQRDGFTVIDPAPTTFERLLY